MKFKKILAIGISESSLGKEYWKKIDADAEKRVLLPKDSPDIGKHLADTDCLFVQFSPVPAEWIESAPKLRYIGVLATGYGKVAIDAARAKGVSVTNVPGYSTESVAEFVFGMLLEQVRDLSRARKQAMEGNFSESGFSAMEIQGKQFGVIGTGRIGARVAEIAKAFGADVRYWNRTRRKDLEAKGITFQEIDELVSQCDILSLHIALTKETAGIMNAKNIRSLKPGMILVNTCAMELVDLSALEERLSKGDITFIFDHSDEMKKEDIDRLSTHPNCIVYPPIGYISKEAKVNQQEIFVGNIRGFLEGNATNVVS